MKDNFNINFYYILIILLSFGLCAGCLREESLHFLPYKGMIKGTVKDNEGNIIKGARVTSLGSQMEAYTNSAGYYTLGDVTIGEAVVIVEADGYQSITRTVKVSGKTITKNVDFVLYKHIYDIKAEKLSNTQVQISFRTPLYTTIILKWGEDSNYGNEITVRKPNKYHKIIVGGLKQGVKYHYKIITYDLSGFKKESEDQTFEIPLQTVPTPVVLNQPADSDITLDSVKLTWSKNNDPDFFAYKLYRSTEPGAYGKGMLVATSTDRDLTTFTDTGLSQDATYYYMVLVLDTENLHKESNEIKVKTKNTTPEAVVLDDPYNITFKSMSLSWSKSTITDFGSYKLFRSLSPDVNNSTSTLVHTQNNYFITNYNDTSLVEGTTYYYKVYVYDKSGLYAGSNIVSGETNNPPPPIVTLTALEITPTYVVLRWEPVSVSDFMNYRIYRSFFPGVNTGSDLRGTVTAMQATTFKDTGLTGETTYYYRVYTTDASGQAMGSNELEIRTPNIIPKLFSGGDITTESYFVEENSPYLITGNVRVLESARVIIQPGVQIEMARGTQFLVEGRISVMGTQDKKVVIKSAEPAPAAGDWQGLILENKPKVPGDKLEYLEIQHADIGIHIKTGMDEKINYCTIINNVIGIKIENQSNPEIYHCTIKYNTQYGIESTNSFFGLTQNRPIIKKSDISENNWDGIRTSNRGLESIDRCKINKNGGRGIRCSRQSNPLITNCNITQNTDYAVEGGGVLGKPGRTDGNYIADNKGLTGYDAALGGEADGYMGTSHEQYYRVDAVLDSKTQPVPGVPW